jgi:hypothetical protein
LPGDTAFPGFAEPRGVSVYDFVSEQAISFDDDFPVFREDVVAALPLQCGGSATAFTVSIPPLASNAG